MNPHNLKKTMTLPRNHKDRSPLSSMMTSIKDKSFPRWMVIFLPELPGGFPLIGPRNELANFPLLPKKQSTTVELNEF